MTPLLTAIRQPEHLARFGLDDWDQLLRMARKHRLLAHLGVLIERHGLHASCPAAALRQIESAQVYARYIQTQARWEVHDLTRTLRDLGTPIMLLKGQSYIAANLPAAPGRFLSDVDVLVPKADLERIEKRLLESGWSAAPLDDYDQRYYREWSHEIPPLRHRERNIELDVHHTLFPVTGRFKPDPNLLWEAARPLEPENLFVLAPEDMFLHSATHLFGGEIAAGFRDLVDMHELILHYGSAPEFWTKLPHRARQLGLTRLLHYALYCLKTLLHSPVPPKVLEEIGQPFRYSLAVPLTRRLATRTLTPQLPGRAEAPFSAWLLYVRSHWIKMPPSLLFTHLTRKGWRRLSGRGY